MADLKGGAAAGFPGKSAVTGRSGSGLRWLLASPPHRAPLSAGTFAGLPRQSLPRAPLTLKPINQSSRYLKTFKG